MKAIDIRSLSTKDKMIIAKAIADIANEIYKSQNEFILNQIIKNGKHESQYGKFWIQTTEAKTVEETLKKKQQDLEKLQKEIKALKLLDKNMQVADTKVALYSKHTDIADDIAKALLQDIYVNIDSKRLNNSMNKDIK